jgi:hypothetical protein
VGQSNDPTFAALNFMKSITADQVRWYNQYKGPSFTFAGAIFNYDAESAKGLRILKAFQALSLRGYWSRLWIIQELFLASGLWLQYGNICIPWGYLDILYTILY